jgi:Cdc6-like AAA superfamily ATPase
LLVAPSRVYKWSVNPFSNPNPVYSHSKVVTIYIRFRLHVLSCYESSLQTSLHEKEEGINLNTYDYNEFENYIEKISGFD